MPSLVTILPKSTSSIWLGNSTRCSKWFSVFCYRCIHGSLHCSLRKNHGIVMSMPTCNQCCDACPLSKTRGSGACFKAGRRFARENGIHHGFLGLPVGNDRNMPNIFKWIKCPFLWMIRWISSQDDPQTFPYCFSSEYKLPVKIWDMGQAVFCQDYKILVLRRAMRIAGPATFG